MLHFVDSAAQWPSQKNSSSTYPVIRSSFEILPSSLPNFCCSNGPFLGLSWSACCVIVHLSSCNRVSLVDTVFCCSVVPSCPTLQHHGLQHTRLPCPSPSPRDCTNSYPLSQWCHPNNSSSVTCFFCLLSFPASGSFPMSRLFASGGWSTGVSASASVLPMIVQGWFPLGWTDLISLQSKGPSGVFSSTAVWKHQFVGAQSL